MCLHNSIKKCMSKKFEDIYNKLEKLETKYDSGDKIANLETKHNDTSDKLEDLKIEHNNLKMEHNDLSSDYYTCQDFNVKIFNLKIII